MIIADAADLKDYDYACWTNKTGGAALTLRITYNEATKSLVISDKIPLSHMN